MTTDPPAGAGGANGGLLHRVRGSAASLAADLRSAPQGPAFRSWAWLVLPLLVLAGGTALIRVFDLDMAAQRFIYERGGGSWALGDRFPWTALYDYGTWPASLVALGALAGYLGSWMRAALRPWRKACLYWVLLMVAGPGLLVNAVFKDNWERPRPRSVAEFGGHYDFEPVLTRDDSSTGKSFAAGHASMGFYFMGGFFLLRRHRRGLARAFFWGGLGAGALIGAARMCQGGHFLSDVLWAGGLCYFPAMGLYYLLGLHRAPLLSETGGGRRMPGWQKGAWSLGGAALAAGLLVATPYEDALELRPSSEAAETGPLDIRISLRVGHADIAEGSEFRVVGESFGHGAPTSRIRASLRESEARGGGAGLRYLERVHGWFAELEQSLRVEVPWERMRTFRLEAGKSSVRLDLAGVERGAVLDFVEGSRTVTVIPGRAPLRIEGGDNAVVEGAGPGRGGAGEGSGDERGEAVLLRVGEGFTGRLVVAGPGEGER